MPLAHTLSYSQMNACHSQNTPEYLRTIAPTVSYLTHSTTASNCSSYKPEFSHSPLLSEVFPIHHLPQSPPPPPHLNREAPLLWSPPTTRVCSQSHPFIFSCVCFPVCHLQQAVSSQRVATLLKDTTSAQESLLDQCAECPFYR